MSSIQNVPQSAHSSWMEVDSILTESSHLFEDSSGSDLEEGMQDLTPLAENHITLLKQYPEMIPDRFKSRFSKDVAFNPIRHEVCRAIFDRTEVAQLMNPAPDSTQEEVEYFNITKRECPACSETITPESFVPDIKLQREIQTFCQRVLEKHDLVLKQKEAVEIELVEKKAETPAGAALKEKQVIALSHLPVGGKGKEYIKNATSHLMGLDAGLVKQHIKKESTKEILWDRDHQIVSILKDGKWRIYKIGSGSGGALAEDVSLNRAIKMSIERA
jgi:hypothetical protein